MLQNNTNGSHLNALLPPSTFYNPHSQMSASLGHFGVPPVNCSAASKEQSEKVAASLLISFSIEYSEMSPSLMSYKSWRILEYTYPLIQLVSGHSGLMRPPQLIGRQIRLSLRKERAAQPA